MSRAIEDYICASEDRSHYNNETYREFHYFPFAQPAYYPIKQEDYPSYNPTVTPQQPTNITINKTIIQQTISKQEVNEIITAAIPQLAEAISNEIEDITINPDIDAAIDEIYGGSASDIIGGSSNP